MSDEKSPDATNLAQVERLRQAANSVQDVAYSLAATVDQTMMTDLLVTSRKLERLADRIQGAVAKA